ncbi:MAG: hypothetical protein HY332_15875 [Chloroflexi bacterium]|nr:hypothetical protein [Chloroflexota bacterium]
MRRGFRLRVVSVAAALFAVVWLMVSPAANVLAGVGTWTSSGPAERIVTVAVDVNNELAVTAAGESGVWQMANGGNAWSKISETRLGWSLAIDPHQPNTLYATDVELQRVLKSADGGASWNAVYSTQRQMRDILVDPHTPNTIYIAGTAPDGLAQVFRSTDGGATWKALLPEDMRGAGGIGQTAVTTLAGLPGVKGTVFAGVQVYHGGRILKSTDGGDTWAAVYNGQLTPLASPDALAVAGTSAENATIYANLSVTGAGGLVRSDDGGATWVKLTDRVPFQGTRTITNLLVHPAKPDWVYASVSTPRSPDPNAPPPMRGVFASNDRGQSWVELGDLDKWVMGSDRLALAIPSRTLFAATESGVYQNTIAWPVLPRFQWYYDAYDGYRLMGTAISLETVVNGSTSQYFEKARLEDHSGESSDPNWQLMYGLLVDELHNAKASLPVGGDESALTYASLNTLANPANRVAPPAGYPGAGVMTIGPDGSTFVPFTADLSGAPGHLVPGRFWAYINRTDLFPAGWLHDIGLPMSPAQQATVVKYLPGGPVQRTITVQAFQRAILTDDPQNPPDWQVERANVGSDYRKFFPVRVGP